MNRDDKVRILILPTDENIMHIPQFSIGLMSGTSMDGIDAALIKTDGIHFIEDITNASLTYDKAFHHALKIAEYSVRKHKGALTKAEKTYALDVQDYVLDSLKLSPQERNTLLKSICDYFGGEFPSFNQVIEHSTNLHAQLIENLLKTSGVLSENVTVIGYHGQTLYHAPPEKITIQVGDGARLAKRTGIPVVYQFRKNDVANGGQGAPFAPLYHQALAIRDYLMPVAIVNCGGISNVTFVLGENEEDLLGFDTGPGNGLIDLYIKRKTQGCETFDENGHYGLHGSSHPELRQWLFKALKDFFQKAPPKSLDIADFEMPPRSEEMNFHDVVRTLEEFTAESILTSLDFIPKGKPIPKLWIVAGGGWKNPVIFNTFQEKLALKIPGCKVERAESLGWKGDALEGQIFAYLAIRSLKGLPLSFPMTTGVSRPLSGGDCVMPSQ